MTLRARLELSQGVVVFVNWVHIVVVLIDYHLRLLLLAVHHALGLLMPPFIINLALYVTAPLLLAGTFCLKGLIKCPFRGFKGWFRGSRHLLSHTMNNTLPPVILCNVLSILY